MRLKFNMGIWGWTETLYWAKQGATLEAAKNTAALVARRRTACLSIDAKLLSIIIRPVDNSLGNYPFPILGGASPEKGKVGILGASTWLSVLFRMADASCFYQRSLWLRGIDSGAISWHGDPFEGALGAAPALAFAGYLNLITNKPGENPGAFCVKGRSHNPDDQDNVAINDAALSEDKCNLDLTLAEPVDWTVPNRVHVSGVRQCGLKGLNGDHRLIDSTGDVITIRGKPCCCLPINLQPGAKVGLVVDGWYPLAFFNADYTTMIRVTKHKAGRPFYGTVGKASKSCK
jgi:hypothetical protein